MNCSIAYVTFPSYETAKDVVQSLLEERLIACANIFQPMQSYFWWEGKIVEEDEIAVYLKTKSEYVGRLQKKIEELSQYECPCILEIPVQSGNSNYLNWVEKSLA